MTKQTMVEKILSRKTGRDVLPNDMIVAPVDLAFAHDGTLPLAIQLMEDELATRAVHDPEKRPDHDAEIRAGERDCVL